MLKLLKKKPVFKGHFFTAHEDTVELPNGEIKVFHSAIRQPSVSVVPIDTEGNVYLVDQYRYQHQKRLTETVAGMIEDGEDPLKTAKRELKEELGIVAGKWKSLGKFHAAGSIILWDQYIFLARDLKFEDQELEAEEDINLLKIPLKKAVQSVLAGKIATYASVCGILLAEKFLNEK